MDVKSSGLNYLKSIDGHIVVPFFQRQYVWKQEQWKRLLDNLLEQDGNQTHFLGSVIIQQENTGAANKRIVKLIDGQQRLTTLSILVKVLLDILPLIQVKITPNTSSRYPVYLEDILLFNNNTTPSIRIQHSHLDKPFYDTIINSHFTSNDFPKDKKGKKDKKAMHAMPLMHQCYQYFYERLKEHLKEVDGAEQIISLIDFLISPTDTQTLVFIELGEHDNAQEIFDTINSTGVRLNTADIIKNALFEKHKELDSNNTTIKFYNQTWQTTFEADEATVKEWDGTVNKGVSFIDNFFYCFAVIEKKGAIDLRKLVDFYKGKLNSCETKADIEKLITTICNSAEQYHTLFIEFYNNATKAIEKDNNLHKVLLMFKELKTTTFHPFILDAYINNDKDELYGSLAAYYMHDYLTGESSKNYNKLAIQFLKDATPLKNYSKSSSIDILIDALETKQFDNGEARLLLFFIELARRNDVTALPYTYSLEHIMPQKWKSYWPLPSNTKENTENRDAAIHLLGNMTLLTQSLNSKIQNHSFKTKMEGNAKHEGIIKLTDLKITQDDIIEPYAAGQTTWDEQRINARTKALAQEIIAIW